jgi:hypothetical protein
MIVLQLDDRWLNELQKETIERMLLTCRHGAQRIDVGLRVDGREYVFEADWLKHLAPPGS